MKDWMRLLRGLNRAAISRVEATTARVNCWPVRAINTLQHNDDTKVEGDQHCCQRAVDERAVYDEVYVVESITKDRYTDGDGAAQATDGHKQITSPQPPRPLCQPKVVEADMEPSGDKD
jgi:hypothetical protein